MPVSPHSMLCLRFRELDFLSDFDQPELPLQSGLFSLEMLFPFLCEFLVGSLLLLHHLFFEDPLLPPLMIEEFFDYQSSGGKESLVSSNPLV